LEKNCCVVVGAIGGRGRREHKECHPASRPVGTTTTSRRSCTASKLSGEVSWRDFPLLRTGQRTELSPDHHRCLAGASSNMPMKRIETGPPPSGYIYGFRLQLVCYKSFPPAAARPHHPRPARTGPPHRALFYHPATLSAFLAASSNNGSRMLQRRHHKHSPSGTAGHCPCTTARTDPSKSSQKRHPYCDG
jgi:hypothetical protein